jgi:hypothetical protein
MILAYSIDLKSRLSDTVSHQGFEDGDVVGNMAKQVK